uniref:Uncharacterized protein n=1 Tax=Graphocephala atropunctata TaxID=36148 RepID=A0A1B6LGI5_9HEMI
MDPTMTIPSGESNIKDVFSKAMINRTLPAPCTMEVDLYQLVAERERRVQTGPAGVGHCRPPFVVQSIPSSDLILVVVHATCPLVSDPSEYPMNVIPSEVYYNGTSLNCQKIKFKHNLPRRRPPSCIKEHAQEEDIKLCGSANKSTLSYILKLTCLVTIYLISLLYKSS